MSNGTPPDCAVCGDPINPDAGKFDDSVGVYADDYAYHLGCEDGVFDEVYCEVDA